MGLPKAANTLGQALQELHKDICALARFLLQGTAFSHSVVFLAYGNAVLLINKASGSCRIRSEFSLRLDCIAVLFPSTVCKSECTIFSLAPGRVGGATCIFPGQLLPLPGGSSRNTEVAGAAGESSCLEKPDGRVKEKKDMGSCISVGKVLELS